MKPRKSAKKPGRRGRKAAQARVAPPTPPPAVAPPPPEADELTPRERRFVLEYLVDLNATQAAIRAGYSPRTARSIGSENLTKPDIRAYVDAAIEERAKRVEVTGDEVLRGLLRIARADIARMVDENDAPYRIREIPEDLRAAIVGFEVEELFEGRGEDRERVGRLHKFKLASKSEAWRDLGRHLKLFTDVLEDRREPMTDEERAARIAAILEAAKARKAKR